MADTGPVISVVIPTYGRHDLLHRAVSSAMSQTCEFEFEVVVVDDNSPDSQIFKSNNSMLSTFGKRVRHLSNTGRRGGAEARNAGIMASAGEWIAFLDDDDEWLPGKLQRQVERISGCDQTVACIDTGFYEEGLTHGRRRIILPQLQGDIFDALLVKHRGRAPKLSTCICRREALLAIGMFDPEFPSRQDLDLYLRLARSYRFESVIEPLVIKYKHLGGRISDNVEKKLGGFEVFYHKYHADLRDSPKLHRLFLRQYANWMWRGKRYSSATWLMLRSWTVRS